MKFTDAIWGSDIGIRFIAVKPPGEALRHHSYRDNKAAIDAAYEFSKAGCEVWYAPQLYVVHDEVKRRQEHIQGIRCFYFDLDVGEGKDYPTLREACEAAAGFEEQINMSFTAWVFSGRGLHLYYIIDEWLDRETWTLYANALRRLAELRGFKFDAGITIDSARILRLPGTANRKDPNKVLPVTLENLDTPITWGTLRESLEPFIQSGEATSQLHDNDDFGIAYPEQRTSAFKIAEQCRQVALLRDGIVDEPQWYATLGVLAFCDIDGDEAAHKWSAQDDRYSRGGTDKKIAQWMTAVGGPATCEKFQRINSKGCEGCPHFGKVSTPLQLGRVNPAVTIPQRGPEGIVLPGYEATEEVVQERLHQAEQIINAGIAESVLAGEGEVDLSNPLMAALYSIANQMGESDANPPSEALKAVMTAAQEVKGETEGIRVDTQGGYYTVGEAGVWLHTKRKNTETGEMDNATLPVWLMQVGIERITMSRSGSEIHLAWKQATGEWGFGVLPQELLADSRELHKWLVTRTIYGFEKAADVAKFLQRFAEHYRKTQVPNESHDNFGWTSELDGFVIGQTLIRSTQDELAYLSHKCDRQMARGLTISGSLEAWVEATEILQHAHAWPQRFAVLACLGTPLMRLLGKSATGAILSLTGEAGVGKTVAVHLGLSAWGDPKALEVAPESTLNYFYAHVGMAQNVPVLMNESNKIKDEILSAMLMAVANGEPKGRAQRDGSMRETRGFCTLCCFTSNRSILGMEEAVLGDAPRRRTIEFILTESNTVTPREGGLIYAAIEGNYGHAGRKLMSEVLRLGDVGNRVRDEFNRLAERISVSNRHALWLIASASVAGHLARSLGLLKWPIESTIESARQWVENHDKEIKTGTDRTADVIDEFLLKHFRQFTKFREEDGGWDEQGVTDAVGRITFPKGDKATRHIAIKKSRLMQFARQQQLDNKHVTDWVKAQGGSESVVKISSNFGSMRCITFSLRDDSTLPQFIEELNSNEPRFV